MSIALSEVGLPIGIARDSERFVHVLQTMDETDPEKIAILQSYMRGLQAVFVAKAVIALSAFFRGLLRKS